MERKEKVGGGAEVDERKDKGEWKMSVDKWMLVEKGNEGVESGWSMRVEVADADVGGGGRGCGTGGEGVGGCGWWRG